MSGENDDATYESRLCDLFKEREGRVFRFLHCYHFLKDKAKFIALMIEEQEKKSSSRAGKKRDVNREIDIKRPLGSKAAKRMKETEKITDSVMNKLGITPSTASSSGVSSNNSGHNPDLSQALASLVAVARDSMSAWQTSMMFDHASDEMKQKMADAAMLQRIREMERAAAPAQENQESPPGEVVILDEENRTPSSTNEDEEETPEDDELIIRDDDTVVEEIEWPTL